MMSTSLERNKGYALVTLTGALVLLGLSTAGLEGRLLSLSGPTGLRPGDNGAAVDSYGALFAAEPFAALLRGEQRRDLFLTTHFNKPTPPTVAPSGPKTRSVALTYLGMLSSSTGGRSVFLRLDQVGKQLSTGAQVIDGWAIASMDASAVVITNNVGTNSIPFRQTIQLTVPVP